MGREYRLSRNPRLREEGGRRPARVPPALPGGIVRFASGGPVTLAGLDVGEDYLDLALIDPPTQVLELTRIGLAGIAAAPDALAALHDRFTVAFRASHEPIIALIDSPRWPSDCDCRLAGGRPRQSGYDGGRRIDSRLRDLTANLAAASESATRLSMFPTPRLEYFRRCIEDRCCKPHLRAIGCELFGCATSPAGSAPRGGAIFTRFMLIGFACYKALEAIGVTAFEAYPDLQFRLWRDNRPVTPKNQRAKALRDRIAIVTAVADRDGIVGADRIRTLDQADAAILAVSMRAALEHGAAGLIEEPEEGRFAVALPRREATRAGLLTSVPLTSILIGAQAASH